MKRRYVSRTAVAVVFVFVLTFSPYAHAAETIAFGINDPITDAIQLWSTMLTSLDTLAHQLASALQLPQALTFNRTANPHAPKNLQQPAAFAASAALATESPPETATTSASQPETTITPQQPQTTGPPEATSDQTTQSPFVKSPDFSPKSAASGPLTNSPAFSELPELSQPAASNPALATPASAFVTQTQFNAAMSALGTSVRQLLPQSNPNPVPEYVGGGGNNADPYAAASNIGQLSNVTINNPTITGLSAGEIPNLSGSYLSLGGGTLTGAFVDSGTASSSFAGALGIGTTSPSDVLAVNGPIFLGSVSPAATASRLYNTGGSLYWNGSLIGGGSVGNWTTDGTSVWRAGGNVGIGTTTPFAQLSIQGALGGNDLLNIASSTGTGILYVNNAGQVGVGIGSSDLAAAQQGYLSALVVRQDTATQNTGTVGFGLSVTRMGQDTAAISLGADNNANGILSVNNRDMNVGYNVNSTFTPVITVAGKRIGGTGDVGNVGIGTTTPWAVLSISNNVMNGCCSNQPGAVPLFVIASTTAGTATSTLFIVTNTGNVGIGTNSPGSLLQLADGTSGDQLRLGSSLSALYKIGRNTATGNLEFDGTQAGSVGYYFKSGNVGIGGAPTAAALNIQGSALGTITTFTDNTNATAAISIPSSGVVRFLGTAGSSLRLGANNADVINIVTGGLVGIGTTSPYSMLSVAGQVVGQNFVATSTTATSTFAGAVGIGTTNLTEKFAAVTADDAAPSVVPTGFDSRYAVFGTTGAGVAISYSGTNGGYISSINPGTAWKPLGFQANNINFFVNGGTTASVVINSSGQMGVGATSPSAKLNVQADDTTNPLSADGGQFQVTGASNTNKSVQIGFNTTGNYGWVKAAEKGVAVRPLILGGNGNVGIGTTSPYSALAIWGPDTAAGTSAFVIANSASTTEFNVLDNGNATLAGTLTQNSDQRLKTNIQSLDASSSLVAIDALNPVTFNWIDPNKGPTPQLGFIAQQVLPIFPNLVATTSPTALTPDGTLSLNYIGLISPIVAAIQALSSELSSIENTIAGFAQKIVTGEVDTQKLCVGSTCVTPAQFQAMLAATNQSGTGASGTGTSTPPPSSDGAAASSSADSAASPPVLQVNGDNPAIIQAGASYTDLGATITGPQAELNLGITTYVNGSEMSPVQIDTSTAATNTIAYVATDQNGLTSTTTRTIIIQAAPSIVPSAAASTTATSSAQ